MNACQHQEAVEMEMQTEQSIDATLKLLLDLPIYKGSVFRRDADPASNLLLKKSRQKLIAIVQLRCIITF